MVTPATGIGDQAVLVRWSGFTPTTPEGLNQVIVVQCGPHPSSLADCFTDQPFPNSANGNEVVNGVTGPDGTGSARFEVRSGPKLPKLGCSQSQACTLLAYENEVVPVGSLPANAAMATITFARSSADCPAVTQFDVRVEGEASAAPVLYGWAARRCTGADKLIVDVTETSSDSGRQDFLHGLVDVGLTSLPATSDELASAPGHPEPVYAPIDLTAVTVAFNLNDPITNQPITDLTLSPRLVARLISDSDLFGFFQDPEFVRLNPAHTFPVNGASPPLIRAEGNADTWLTTNWLASDASTTAFLTGHDPEGVAVNQSFQGVPYPTSIFENRALDDSYLPRQGQYAAATRLFYGARPIDTSPLDPASVGFLGVVDLATARRFQLPTAKLVNAAGVAVAPDLDKIMAGYAAMKPGAGGTLVADPAAKDPNAYPLVKLDYAMLPANPSTALLGAVRNLFTWGMTDGQQGLPDGVLPLPKEQADATRVVLAGLGTTANVPTDPTTTSGGFTDTTCCTSGYDAASGYSAPYESSLAATEAVAAAAAAKALGPDKLQRTALVSAKVADAAAPIVLPLLMALGLAAALAAGVRLGWWHTAPTRRARRGRRSEPAGADES